MIGAFTFLHDNRTYNCRPEKIAEAEAEAWWWFTVSSDSNRYAPFRAHAKDTRVSVQSRIVDYYANLMARRSAPAKQHWAQRGKAAAPKNTK